MDLAKAWETYKAAWSQGKALAMDAKTFNELFFDGGMASECINLLNGSHGAAVRATPNAFRLHAPQVRMDVC